MDSVFRNVQILLVEANICNQAMIRSILTERGIAVDTASNGTDALVMAGYKRYDAILMDLHLPGMEGFMTARKIRKLETGIKTPIIAMSEVVMNEFVELADQYGMNGCVFKPIELAELFFTLELYIVDSGLSGSRFHLTDGVHEL
ncbi:response regulator [Paenibacillus montanisoli]|nr:response regulator [Paenibacillus montanisoli]